MSYPKLAALLLVIAGAFGAGWYGKGWKSDSEALVIERAVTAANQSFAGAQQVVASVVEEKLKELKGTERVIEHEKVKIVDRPVYINTCLDSDGLRLANSAKSGNYTK